MEGITEQHDLSNVHDANSDTRHGSPALTNSTSLSCISVETPDSFVGLLSTSKHSLQATEAPPAKRRKLTESEKEVQRVERERSKKERAEKTALREQETQRKADEKRQAHQLKEEQKKLKDAEKLKKDEERRVANEFKEEQKRERDLDRLRREDERRKIEEEKQRKEKAQSRINTFFARPRSAKPGQGNHQTVNDDQSSARIDKPSAATGNSSDYRRTFLPFALPTNSVCAPISRSNLDDSAVKHVELAIEKAFDEDQSSAQGYVEDAFCSSTSSRRPVHSYTVKQIIRALSAYEADDKLADLQILDPLGALSNIPMRYLSFREDVRPAYVGTFSKLRGCKLFRQPFARLRPDTNYDYDSEAEWEEPEEGEDVESDGASDAETLDDGEDMDEFLDDADDGVLAGKKIALADMQPHSTGIRFVGEPSVGPNDLARFQMETLLGALLVQALLTKDNLVLPIDPFASAYWTVSDAKTLHEQQSSATSTLQIPLCKQMTPTKKGTIASTSGSVKVKPPVRLLTGLELDQFKQAVDGSTLTKTLLLGSLKEQ